MRNVCETANTGYTKAEHWPPTRVQNLCVLPLSKHSPQLLSRTLVDTLSSADRTRVGGKTAPDCNHRSTHQ